MARYETLHTELKDAIRQILQISGVAQGSIHVEKVGKGGNDGQHWTVFDNDITGPPSDDTESEDATIYGIGSITKQLIALLLCIIVNKLSYSKEQEHAKFRAIRDKWDDPWDVKFTVLFNFFSETKILPLPRNPTLRHVAIHYNSFPPMNHILLAVDGTSIISKESFLNVAPRLAQIAYKDSTEDYNEYSNSGYIMIGYLIEAIGQNSLAVLIQEYLFRPLGMTKTYMEAPDFNTSRIAQPYSIAADGTRNRVAPWPFHAHSVVSSALGAYSCTRDLAILFRAIIGSLNGIEPVLTKDIVANLLKPDGTIGEDRDAISLFGICTFLHTSTPGSMSYNRLISPNDECSTYRLGYKGGDKEVQAYYLAGTTNGYSCSAYLLPKWETFVVVLTNSTPAFADASDHISRLILQRSFDLGFDPTPKFAGLGRIFQNDKDVGRRASGSIKVVDIIAMSSLAASSGKKLLEKLRAEDTEKITPSPRPIHLDGRYHNEKTEQSIVISKNQAKIVGTCSGALRDAQPMDIIRTGDKTIRLCPLSNSRFSIDRYDQHGWRNLNFELRTGKKQFQDGYEVVGITRQIPPFLDQFNRTEASFEGS